MYTHYITDAHRFNNKNYIMINSNLKIIRRFKNTIGVRCAFCEGTGQFPELSGSDENHTSDPCPICKAKGFNIFTSNIEKLAECLCCDKDGKAVNKD
ncbi:MAG TPA: hypothetical protein VGB37_03395, partial [Candidatus Lokiarchaeia archaeon]